MTYFLVAAVMFGLGLQRLIFYQSFVREDVEWLRERMPAGGEDLMVAETFQRIVISLSLGLGAVFLLAGAL